MTKMYLNCIYCREMFDVTHVTGWSKVSDFKSTSADICYGFCPTCSQQSADLKRIAIEAYRPIDKCMDMPAGSLAPEQSEIYYKVVRYRDNGKIHVYPEEFQDLEQAKIRMQQSATGKYFGHCRVFCYMVSNGKASVIGKQGKI